MSILSVCMYAMPIEINFFGGVHFYSEIKPLLVIKLIYICGAWQ